MTTPSMRTPERPPSQSVAAQAFQPHDLSDPGSSAAWSIISYILSGILFWGLLGWWLDKTIFDDTTTVLLPIGVIVGTAAGGYLGYMKYLQAMAGFPAPMTSTTE